MYRLTLLGATDLRGEDGHRIGSVLSQPKRMALLSLLALESPRLVQRDEIMARLWPESTPDRGRNALRQGLHYLSRSLGPEAVVGKGSEAVGLDPRCIECDAALLVEAAAEGRHADVVALYAGDLLSGFHYDDAPPPFEHWLETNRRQLRETAATSAWEVAEAEEAAGNPVGAGVAARQACELGNWGEPAVHRLLELLIRTGDATGAENAYHEFAERLHREQGRVPGRETRELLERIEPSPAVAGAASASTPAPEPASSELASSPGGDSSTWSLPLGRRRWLVAAVGLPLLLVALWGIEAGAASNEEQEAAAVAAASARPSLYLQPIRDISGTDSGEALAAAVEGELAARLAEADGFRVVAGRPESPRTVGPGVKLQGSLRRVDDRIQLSVLVLDPASDAVLDRLAVVADPEPGSAPDVLASQMATEIRQGVGGLLTWRGLVERGISPRALEEIRTAAEESRAATEFRRDGMTEAAVAAYRAADSLLARAEALDPVWAEPTLRRAEISLSAMWLHLLPPDRNLELAHQEVLRGLEHAQAGVEEVPGDARAHETRGLLYHWAGNTASRAGDIADFQEAAEADLLAAVRLDPNRPKAWSTLSAMAETRGDFPAAYHRARRAYATDRDLAARTGTLVRLFSNAMEIGDYEAAGEWCLEVHERDPDHWTGSYCDLMRMAWAGPWSPAASDSILRAVRDRLPRGAAGAPIQTRFRLLHAVVLARAGQEEGARAVLETVDAADSRSLDVLELAAWVSSALGETRRARQLLAAAAEVNPEAAAGMLKSRRYTELSTYAVVRRDE